MDILMVTIVREDAAEADLGSSCCLRDLRLLGSIIRQYRPKDEYGNYLRQASGGVTKVPRLSQRLMIREP